MREWRVADEGFDGVIHAPDFSRVFSERDPTRFFPISDDAKRVWQNNGLRFLL